MYVYKCLCYALRFGGIKVIIYSKMYKLCAITFFIANPQGNSVSGFHNRNVFAMECITSVGVQQHKYNSKVGK